MDIVPQRLGQGDEIRVIAPSSSMSQFYITKEIKDEATHQLQKMGFKVSFGKHVEEIDEFGSSSVEHRLEDLHAAFADKNVKAILTVIGGFNANELLSQIDYGLIKQNPKIFCGYSDITALQNAMYRKTGLITYSGPHYFTFGVKHDEAYTENYFTKCLSTAKPFEVKPAAKINEWSSKRMAYVDYQNGGTWTMMDGEARGKIIGGNLCTFNLLQGTEFMPKLKNSVLFVEDDSESDTGHFARDLQSLFHTPDADSIRGLVLGRFQEDSKIGKGTLAKILKTVVKQDIPIIANADFGHTYPLITFPIGGTAKITASEKSQIKILKH
jgi:muramoyltetrapeptide carboxypeptidase